jgi:hypothetical protein
MHTNIIQDLGTSYVKQKRSSSSDIMLISSVGRRHQMDFNYPMTILMVKEGEFFYLIHKILRTFF